MSSPKKALATTETYRVVCPVAVPVEYRVTYPVAALTVCIATVTATTNTTPRTVKTRTTLRRILPAADPRRANYLAAPEAVALAVADPTEAAPADLEVTESVVLVAVPA